MLGGKFRVERVLGVGGMGVVVAAHHLLLDRRVALKFLLPAVTKQPVAVARFTREAQAAARIQSEHVARVLDVGALETGAPYLVMEFLEGQDLAAEIETRGQQPIPLAIDYVLQAAEAVAEAHALGIVHRDLKPANLFLTKRADGTPLIKVLDFGISKHTLLSGAQAAAPALTQTSSQLGSPAYMSPEQLRSSKDVDARADIWALGLILQELLTGKTAFSVTTLPELHVAILTQPPAPLRRGRPDAPAELELVVARCLEKERERRYRNVAELASGLAPFCAPASLPSVERIGRVLGVPTAPAGAPVGPTVDDRPRPQPTPLADVPSYPGFPTQPTGPAPLPGPAGFGPPGGFGPPPPAFPPGPALPRPGGVPMAAGYGPGGAPGPMGPMGPMGMTYLAPPPETGTSTATIVLIVLVVMIAVGMGGCMLCVCAANASGGPEAPEAASPGPAAALAR